MNTCVAMRLPKHRYPDTLLDMDVALPGMRAAGKPQEDGRCHANVSTESQKGSFL